MNSLLIIGGDSLGVIPDKLSSCGFDKIIHTNGRKVKMIDRKIPDHINCILVLTDYVNHNLSSVIKRRAKTKSIPIFYAKRSWSSIHQALEGVI
ncbi:DUF2325 domain-containing protein [Bacillus tuaregi]|uniref:DUF2325 domain-containing protein n=1 Tax=Bacillus tuaregi TaxID=1816695 RepID=UPI0008F8C49C|nr:DUF2325 domain-containing protein [Bacillus tuaregi]